MKTISNIIVPVDLEDHTDKIIEYAAYMAEKLSAGVTVLHIVELLRAIGDMDIASTTIDDYNANRASHAHETLKKYLTDYPSFSAEVISGEIVDEIVAYAEEKQAELIIIGTHGSKGIEKLLLGSVAERVVKNAHCPTLVMNPYKQ